MSNNADEISVDGVNNAGDEEGPEEVLFLWESVVSSLFSSGNNFSGFVPSVEVDDIPNSDGWVVDDNEKSPDILGADWG